MTELDIVAFLTEQYDADEAIARDASNLQDDPQNGWGSIPRPGIGTRGAATITPHIGLLYESESVAHVVRFNPARVLADIAAKRRIVHRHRDCGSGIGYCDDGGHGHDWEGATGGCGDLCDAAAPFADRPGYNPDWAVSE